MQQCMTVLRMKWSTTRIPTLYGKNKNLIGTTRQRDGQSNCPIGTLRGNRKENRSRQWDIRSGSFADLAVLTRAWRKPIYKNIRYLYVKDGVIVEYERVGRRLPANALSLAGDLREAAKHIKKRLAALGADSFFMVHNQYYVYSTPSAVDGKLAILGKAPGIKGHVVLNPCYFGLITIKGIAILRVLPDMDLPRADPVTGTRLNLTAAMDYPVSTIAHWAKALTRRRRPVVVSMRDDTVLRELQEISLDKIDTWNQLMDILAKRDDPAFECPSLDVAGPLSKYGAWHFLRPH